MRSRDGNCAFSLSIFSLILFTALSLGADEYLVSYRYIVKDAALYNENLYISNAMQKCDGNEADESLTLQNYGFKDFKSVVSKHQTEFIDYIHKLGLDLHHTELTVDSQNTSTTILTLKTTCFKVEFNDKFVIIVPIK